MDKEIVGQLAELLNTALAMEHGASIQYGSNAEIVTGLYAEPIIARLKDSQHDEEKHADVLRGLIGDYLKFVPTINVTKPKLAMDTQTAITQNIETEKEAIEHYLKVLNFLADNEAELIPIYARVEHDVRHILMEEIEHQAELERIQ